MDPQFPSMTPPPTSASSAEAPGWPRSPRALAANRGLAWWSEGWRIFLAAPVLWIGVIVVLFIIMLVLSFIPLLGNLAQAILWPVFGGGLILGCHALAQGHPLAFDHLFAGFKDGRTGPLAILGLIGCVVSIVLVMIMMMFGFGAAGLAGAGAYLSGDQSGAAGVAWGGAGAASLLGILLAIVAGWLFWMAWFFATPLVALNRAPPFDAVKASFGASYANLGALALFALVFLGLAIVASIPFGLGWLVLGPVAVGASYAAWREVFGA